ncbi:MAG TPA: bifunctional glutamate N-acetyltransferase/amino-acid acetyltransferase ArgJ [Pseudomonadales bacterium]|nr:bifunctional glutamate N-acetyltransferase/amino-acid acetyltransferase ArgJ [Pseudomonadales bacterium]
MPVNLPPLPELDAVAGLRCATVQAGVRKANRDDLVLFELCEGATVAALFTRNRFRAAPVRLAERHLDAATPRYLLVNTGNANAGTGRQGDADALACCQALADAAGVAVEQVLPYSTGVIGERLPAQRIVDALPQALDALRADGWNRAARGIMTTDTAPKGVSVHVAAAGGATVTGISKGAGMIRPDMATMLAFVATDAAVAPKLLRRMLIDAVEGSFNRITVDGDTSTNDCVTLVATGAAGTPAIDDPDDEAALALAAAIAEVCTRLAQAIVRDGEGATRFVTVDVGGARTAAEALACAYTIAESPLVKTALFAGDPNWGRLLAAIGRSGMDDLDVDGVSIRLGDVSICEQGGVAPTYREADGARVMAEAEITISVDLGRGAARERVWTTDLSYDYVKINAEYRS